MFVILQLLQITKIWCFARASHIYLSGEKKGEKMTTWIFKNILLLLGLLFILVGILFGYAFLHSLEKCTSRPDMLKVKNGIISFALGLFFVFLHILPTDAPAFLKVVSAVMVSIISLFSIIFAYSQKR